MAVAAGADRRHGVCSSKTTVLVLLGTLRRLVMIGRRFTFGLLSVSSALAMAVSCASMDDAEGGAGGTCQGPKCEPVDAPTETIAQDGPGEAMADAAPKVNPLCGSEADECVADFGSPGACADHDGGPPGPTEAGVGDSGFDEDAGAGFSPPDLGADAEPAPANGYGCHVTNDDGTPSSQCLPSGAGKDGSPCAASNDCAPGFACVGIENAAQCRPYCCADPDACPPSSFCTERPLRDSNGELEVPVCAPADNCNLAEQYPCPSGSTCTCPAETACMVVREQTTSCIQPGTGTEGDACPCAWGHVCSKANNKCLKLCQWTSSSPECGSQKCVSVAYLPDGWGVCS